MIITEEKDGIRKRMKNVMEMNHVLVVEDDKEIREGVEIYLKSQGYEVFQAADGAEGLDVIEREAIHLADVYKRQAVDIAKEKDIISPELKKAGDKLVWLRIETDNYDIPIYGKVMDQYGKFTEDIHSGKIVAAYALDRHGIAAAVSKMAFGNGMGVKKMCIRDRIILCFSRLIDFWKKSGKYSWNCHRNRLKL